MNNDFYYNDNQNNNVKYSSSQKSLLLAFAAIILIAIGYILITNGMFDKVTGIETTTERKIVYIGEEETIKVKIKNNGNFDPKVKFRSKKDKFTLSEDIQYGEKVETKIKGSKAGYDTLVIAAGKGGKKEKEARVEVLVCDKPEITNTGDKTLNIKEKTTVKLKFNVEDECLKGYKIEIENESIVDLDSNYNLTAKKQGTTNLVLKNNNGRIKYKINVNTTNVTVKSVSIDDKNFNLAIGKTKKLSVSVLPSDAENRKVTYTSSNENVATVSSNGTVKGIGVGVATITVKSVSDTGKKDTLKVKVYEKEPPVVPDIPVKVTSIKFGQKSYTIAYKETKKLTLGITPTNATNKSITCKSKNTGIVTVSHSGNTCIVKGINIGTTTIEAYSVDGNKKATATITVINVPVKSIAFEKANYSIYAGGSSTLKVKFSPTNASNQVLTCASSDTSVATVSAKGASCVVKGVKAGTITITATSKDGNKITTASVKVTAVTVTGIKFSASSYSVNEGKTITLTPTVLPSNATNKKYTCSSSNTSVATITSGCTVKGVKAGTAIITATTNDGGYTAQTNIKVKETIKKVTIKVATFNVGYFACGSYSGAHCSPSGTSIGNLIKSYGVDIVGLQEARDTGRGSGRCYYGTSNVEAVKRVLGYNMDIACPININAILSKYAFQGTPQTTNMSCGETRAITKVVLKINGVNISFYNTHLGLSNCNEEHFKKVADLVKNDPNPVIMTADWNHTAITRFNKYFIEPEDMKFKMAAYDTSTHNMWNKTSYCDAVLVKSKGHIDIVSSQTVDAFQSYSDHNMVIATLKIY